MSLSVKTRPQYVFIKVLVPRSQSERLVVTVSGPSATVKDIYESDNLRRNTCGISCYCRTLASTSELSMEAVNASSTQTFMKACLLEEVLMHGFTPESNVTDDSILLSRQVLKERM